MELKQAKEIVIELEKKYRGSKLNGIEILSELSDRELIAYIAMDTLAFGRPWAAAIDNANLHIKKRERAIKLFGTPVNDYF